MKNLFSQSVLARVGMFLMCLLVFTVLNIESAQAVPYVQGTTISQNGPSEVTGQNSSARRISAIEQKSHHADKKRRVLSQTPDEQRSKPNQITSSELTFDFAQELFNAYIIFLHSTQHPKDFA